MFVGLSNVTHHAKRDLRGIAKGIDPEWLLNTLCTSNDGISLEMVLWNKGKMLFTKFNSLPDDKF